MEDCLFEPVELVNLREKETKKPLDYRDTRQTRHVREVLRTLNGITDRSLVQYLDPKSKMGYRLQTQLYAVYTDDF